MSKNPHGGGNARLEAALTSGNELLAQLRSTLERAGELVRVLEENLHKAAAGRDGESSGDRAVDLERRLARTESDVKELADQLVESEHQAGRLMNLYVATYQLHSSLDPDEVQSTIAEVAVNLLGAERFVLLLRRDDGNVYEAALRHGVEESSAPLFASGSYEGGDAMVDATLADGVLRLGPAEGSTALAAVPLRVQGDVVGALVVLELFEHKPSLRSEDRDLLDLLSAHAASALFAARLFATQGRKLRTLESLVKLARGE